MSCFHRDIFQSSTAKSLTDKSKVKGHAFFEQLDINIINVKTVTWQNLRKDYKILAQNKNRDVSPLMLVFTGFLKANYLETTKYDKYGLDLEIDHKTVTAGFANLNRRRRASYKSMPRSLSFELSDI